MKGVGKGVGVQNYMVPDCRQRYGKRQQMVEDE
jgi:hypothetical protein